MVLPSRKAACHTAPTLLFWEPPYSPPQHSAVIPYSSVMPDVMSATLLPSFHSPPVACRLNFSACSNLCSPGTTISDPAQQLSSTTTSNLWRVVVPRPGDHHPPPGHEWGYVPPPWPAAPVVPPPSHHHNVQPPRPIKRPLSTESDDGDDAFSEESSKEQCSPSDTDSCQMLSRKKRRGIIEKRRRDRINTSLLELRRLVPSAFEKQGSAKLEKAEILQMTVDHLKNLHTKGVENMAYDPSKIAMDYHNIGFRECAAEVARYLVTVEGLDLQDPLRLRLMSHLQCFAAQRDTSKQPHIPTPSTTHPWPPAYGNHLHDTSVSSSEGASSANTSYDSNISGGGGSSACDTSSSTPPTLMPLTPATPTSFSQPYHSIPNHQTTHQPPPYHHHHQDYSTPQKPYRPWGGTELAY